MKLIFVTIENAVTYHEPDDRRPARILNSTAETLPVPVASETSIPEVADDLVFFQVRDSEGKILLQLPIQNYVYVMGRDRETMTFEKVFNVRQCHLSSSETEFDDRPPEW